MSVALAWNPSELQQIQSYIVSFEKDTYPRHSAGVLKAITMSAAEALGLNLDKDLSCLRTGLPLRHALSKIGFDEKRVLKWQVDHKLIQALMLRHYSKSAISVTCGLNALLLSGEYSCLDELLSPDHTPGLILKRTVGHGSTPVRSYETDRAIITSELARLRSGYLRIVSLEEEQFIVQQRIPIEIELRVYTLEDKVVDGMTHRKFCVRRDNMDYDYARHRDYAVNHDNATDCDGANAFVHSVLERLPNALVAETLCGWDVARSVEGEWKVLEINYAGFSLFERGFHCSGYFQEANWGFTRIARLLHFIEKVYATQIAISSDQCPDHELANYYWWISHALEFFRERSRLMEFIRTIETSPSPIWTVGNNEVIPAGIVDLKQCASRLKTSLEASSMKIGSHPDLSL